ncbi:DUF1501 domain-containing protein [Roseiflexus sp.]|uniref:DUF1501 domain-containing protein n=1 Tax=Roseiflexus sp. TaxID=2562120 RepID=UPI0021DE1837|nr:DUF1501 domain-containing protein [Roseiflexus sp.]GIW02637.1 MAG: hypothetical protein KatS3mg058_4040 [Roseiflexus sp.]
MTLSRRNFVVGCSAAIAALTGGAVRSLAFAQPGDTTHRDILVVVFLRGGCDGLSLVAPVNDPFYRGARGDLRVEESGQNAGLRFGNPIPGADFRLHPRATPLLSLYINRSLAIVHACGLRNGTRSHFEAMDYMEGGIPESGVPANGWLARYLNGINASGYLPAVSAGARVPFSMTGFNDAAALTDPGAFNLSWNSWRYRSQLDQALDSFYSGDSPVQRAGRTTLTTIVRINERLPRDSQGRVIPYTPENGAVYPGGRGASLGSALRTVAGLIKMDVGLIAATVDYGGWDTHEGQSWIFPELVAGLSEALYAFYNDLWRYHHRLTIVVMSEFGRRLKANRSSGTDHGHGNVMLALGEGIRGGKMYGVWPGLATEQLDNGVDLAITTDYRAVLSEILVKRGGHQAVDQVFPGFSGSPLGLAYAPGETIERPQRVNLPLVTR